MFPRNETGNECTFGCREYVRMTKTGTRAHSPKPPFYETALLSPIDNPRISSCASVRFEDGSLSDSQRPGHQAGPFSPCMGHGPRTKNGREMGGEMGGEMTSGSRHGRIPPIRLGLSGRNSRRIPERPRKRSRSLSWNSPREHGWDPPDPIIRGI